MKKLLLTLILGLSLVQSQAQQFISFKGQIKNVNVDEPIYLVLDGITIKLDLLENSTFSINTNIQQVPSFFYFANIGKNGKILQQTPRTWFDKNIVEINIDWSEKTFQTLEKLPYQLISEKIESLKFSEQNKFILSNPVNLPILYFVSKNKEDIPMADLEIFTQKVDTLYQGSIYFKRIEAYINAKKKEAFKNR